MSVSVDGHVAMGDSDRMVSFDMSGRTATVGEGSGVGVSVADGADVSMSGGRFVVGTGVVLAHEDAARHSRRAMILASLLMLTSRPPLLEWGLTASR